MELNKKQEKGIDLVVKSVSKKFPFIKGWTLNEVKDDGYVIIFIDLYVDIEDYLKNFDLYPSSFIQRYSDKKGIKGGSLWHWGSEEPDGVYVGAGNEEYVKYGETSKRINEHIREILKDRYEQLPEEYQVRFYNDIRRYETPASLLNFNLRLKGE
jgi:hypothetical protein